MIRCPPRWKTPETLPGARPQHGPAETSAGCWEQTASWSGQARGSALVRRARESRSCSRDWSGHLLTGTQGCPERERVMLQRGRGT